MSTIHLMGLGPGWSLAPQCGPGVKIWGINNVLCWRPVDYVFELHDWYNKLSRIRGGQAHLKGIRKGVAAGIPYIVRERWPFVPSLKQVIYPWEAIFERFQTDFLGCSMDCMLALAIYCGYKTIHMYGIGINKASRYDYQIPSMNYWAGVCTGAEIDLRIHTFGGYRHTDMLRNFDGKVYGLKKPQRKWPTLDVTLPDCDCVRKHEAYHCNDFDGREK